MKTEKIIGIAILTLLLMTTIAYAADQSLGEKAGEIAGGVVSGTITAFFTALKGVYTNLVNDPTIKSYELDIKKVYDSEFRRNQNLQDSLKSAAALQKEATDLLSSTNSEIAYSKGTIKSEDPKAAAQKDLDDIFK